jgi:signal recognition particle subunit SRP54
MSNSINDIDAKQLEEAAKKMGGGMPNGLPGLGGGLPLGLSGFGKKK